MKLIIQNARIAGSATDDYNGLDEFITVSDSFDITRAEEYLIIDGELVLQVKPEQQIISEKIGILWAAADRYVTGYISGVAIGILTIGVIQKLPKALAVTAWSSSVWAEYYIRKDLVTSESIDNHDFSMFGAMPHTVPELQQEIGL